MTTVSVSATEPSPTHHISLSDGSTTYGMIVPSGASRIQEFPYQPSSLQFNQGRSGYASFELPYSSIDQSDWTGGRGQLKFDDDSRFYDSYNMWTITPGIMTPAPQAMFWQGVRKDNGWMPGADQAWSEDAAVATGSFGDTFAWASLLTGSTLYQATQFTSGSAYTATHLWVVLRYFGSPGPIKIELRNDGGSDLPGSTVHASVASIATTDIDESWGVGQMVQFDFGTAYGLTDATKYWIVFSQNSGTHNSTNYWQVAAGKGATNPTWALSTDDSTWNGSPASTSPPYFRVTDADVPAEHFFINYKRGLYSFTKPFDGSTAKIFFNGDRGVATGATQTSTTMDDTTKSWTASQWIGQYLHIWNGTGEGQYRKVTANDADTLTVSPAFDITPVVGAAGTGSEYLIVGTDRWQNVTPSGSGAKVTEGPVVSKPITLWGIIYLPQGQNYNILRVREYNNAGVWNSFWGGNSASGTYGTNVSDNDGSNKADFLAVAYDPVNENIIWRAENNANPEWVGPNQTSVSRADDITWSGTDLSFGNVIPIGIPDTLITGLQIYNGKLWVGKEDSIWFIDNDGSYDRAYPVQVGLDAMISPRNAIAMAVQDLYLYFNWSHSIERFFLGTMDDMGPWKDAGMLDRTRGYVHSIVPVIGWIFASVNGGPERQSSILMWNGSGWHTVFRGQKGKQITNLYWQSNYGDENAFHRLWFSYHGDVMYMPFPNNTVNLQHDPGIPATISSYVIHSEMDAGYVELEKYINQINVAHGDDGAGISIDYAIDSVTPDEPTFTAAGSGSSSASDSISIAQSRKKRVFIRTRLHPTNSQPNTTFVKAVVMDAVARVPVKYNWKVPIRLKDNAKTLNGLLDHDPDTLYSQLTTWAGQAQALTLRSVLSAVDNKTVFIEPPSPMRDFWNRLKSWWGGTVTFTLREV